MRKREKETERLQERLAKLTTAKQTEKPSITLLNPLKRDVTAIVKQKRVAGSDPLNGDEAFREREALIVSLSQENEALRQTLIVLQGEVAAAVRAHREAVKAAAARASNALSQPQSQSQTGSTNAPAPLPGAGAEGDDADPSGDGNGGSNPLATLPFSIIKAGVEADILAAVTELMEGSAPSSAEPSDAVAAETAADMVASAEELQRKMQEREEKLAGREVRFREALAAIQREAEASKAAREAAVSEEAAKQESLVASLREQVSALEAQLETFLGTFPAGGPGDLAMDPSRRWSLEAARTFVSREEKEHFEAERLRVNAERDRQNKALLDALFSGSSTTTAATAAATTTTTTTKTTARAKTSTVSLKERAAALRSSMKRKPVWEDPLSDDDESLDSLTNTSVMAGDVMTDDVDSSTGTVDCEADTPIPKKKFKPHTKTTTSSSSSSSSLSSSVTRSASAQKPTTDAPVSKNSTITPLRSSGENTTPVKTTRTGENTATTPLKISKNSTNTPLKISKNSTGHNTPLKGLTERNLIVLSKENVIQ